MTVEFIDLKAQLRSIRIPINQRIQKVLDHGQFIMGPEVAEMEQRLATFTGAKHCISVASGTEALLIALMALGIGRGDEVITTPFTFVATAEVIVLLGATPVFVDVEPDTCNIDPEKIEAAITSRTKAIMPVSLYGATADMDEINAIGAKHGLPVIEDAAQSFGAEYRSRKSCNVSAIGCTSFFPSKPLGCYGDGGAIFVSDDTLARAMREIRTHGQESRYYHTRIGVGGRMDTLQCAVILAKLETFDWEIAERIRIGRAYRDMVAEIPGVQGPVIRNDRTCVWAQFTIQTDERDAVTASLKEVGVPTAIHYPIPLHKQPAYRSLCRIVGEVDVSNSLSERVLSLPMHPYLDERTMHTVVHALAKAKKSL
ncbi:DegT/DnrJ/EryC1/StrS aminotransferase family protein [Bradyrhizobium sp. CIR3A]|uniref:DegT/DnrJ/EryC1/StrS family aminotransferase n=1 Tax=Bradyrhizobium sp. CIR3A TaxID=2663838 RepID=UPI001605FC7F|nr:DegT/DnrJ/EryC1/StrS family aminotransferase [Bradyrhizobium sp. CIR3A]MBB4258748.1 UDP-2-acetamido-2-deoxy-ribo-hexuluronate aminotransferase [Bradyrhizobium sp. CIR3A]